MKTKTKELALSVLLLGCAGTSHAALITADFTGTVTENNPIVASPPIGSSISGSFTIDASDTTGLGINCAGTPYCWSDATASWTWRGTTLTGLESHFFTFGVFLTIDDSPAGFGFDTLTISLRGTNTPTILTLRDSSGKAFEKADIPFLPSLSSFDLASFSYTPICVTTISCAVNPFYSGQLTSFSAAPSTVPIPAAAWLFGSALLGLGALKRKKA